jgi:hypothetical protein
VLWYDGVYPKNARLSMASEAGLAHHPSNSNSKSGDALAAGLRHGGGAPIRHHGRCAYASGYKPSRSIVEAERMLPKVFLPKRMLREAL